MLRHRLNMTQRIAIIGAGLLLCAMPLFAKELEPLISKSGRLLLNENFGGAAIPVKWEPGGRSNAFQIVDGALQGVCPADDHHGPWCGVPITGSNLTIRFALKLPKPGVFLMLVDGASQFSGTAHLLRFAAHGGGVALQQDRGSLESKRQQAAARTKAIAEGRKIPPPTKEQLADPKFYRTETLAKDPLKLCDGQWHQVLIETRGNEVAAQVDGQVTLRATGTVLEAQKTRLVFLIGQSGLMQVDDVKVWGNEPR